MARGDVHGLRVQPDLGSLSHARLPRGAMMAKCINPDHLSLLTHGENSAQPNTRRGRRTGTVNDEQAEE